MYWSRSRKGSGNSRGGPHGARSRSPHASTSTSQLGRKRAGARLMPLMSLKERQREGIAIARTKGVYKGRKRSLTPDRVAELRSRAAAGEKKARLARQFSISRETLYQYVFLSIPTRPPVDRSHNGLSASLHGDVVWSGTIPRRRYSMLWLCRATNCEHSITSMPSRGARAATPSNAMFSDLAVAQLPRVTGSVPATCAKTNIL